jgi:hypothetical protein
MPRIYNESLFVARLSLENGTGSSEVVREWEYNDVQRSTTELSQLPVGNSHGKLVIEKELEVSQRRLSV